MAAIALKIGADADFAHRWRLRSSAGSFGSLFVSNTPLSSRAVSAWRASEMNLARSPANRPRREPPIIIVCGAVLILAAANAWVLQDD